ncbi:MAG: hypothetical protein JXA46_18555 [Dehalococcoidales bacterium]|nr:hypothetical protein [Dehalococcoidales bacterium]
MAEKGKSFFRLPFPKEEAGRCGYNKTYSPSIMEKLDERKGIQTAEGGVAADEKV